MGKQIRERGMEVKGTERLRDRVGIGVDKTERKRLRHDIDT